MRVLPRDGYDAKGRTPLALAARASHLATCEALVRAGASPALDAELVVGDGEVSEEVRLFLASALSAWRRSRSALLLAAAAADNVPAMRALHLEQGADALHADEKGFTALHHAAANGCEGALLYLLQAGEAPALVAASTADAGATSDWRPEQLAAAHHPKLRQYLLDYKSGGEQRQKLVAYARRRLGQQLGPGRLGPPPPPPPPPPQMMQPQPSMAGGG